MIDTILRGTGNSRTLRTVANAKSQYPTYDAFMTALVNGTFPIDIGALSSAGLTRRGTDLNKANILTDSTATGMGLTSSATPNDAFSKLRALVKAAQDTADTSCHVLAGSYVGTGAHGESGANRLDFPFAPKLLVITENTDFAIGVSTSSRVVMHSGSRGHPNVATFGKSYVSWYYAGGGYESEYPYFQLNSSGRTYHYAAIG